MSPCALVLESGTGSGSLTHSLIRAVAPHGQGLTLVHFSAEPEPSLTQIHPVRPLIAPTPRNTEP